ncbi:MAG TPA: hypothetical protein DDZ96_05705 [Porphyromonadaceae bacterium]|jgi:hypothetical protein|nr:hypothetical protein [Porphyromonadaceae bacterium]HBL33301.1 hypothetical protein [Porphyromonadaceae bacterium]HBX19413.1 hypothetical protein [Porphyromonadaceae bacterium]HBX45249.1 hypothetical protein [Porphyromonadaceae bacterium]HCM22547.1 hypothetical protein [Porphyromonadaceae bacterium]
MEITVKERIKLFLKHLNIGQNKFEAKVGWSNGYINNTKNISSDKLNQIIKEYPQLNLTWLITGKGEMINSDRAEQTTDVEERRVIDFKDKYLEVLEENRFLRIEIEKLRNTK